MRLMTNVIKISQFGLASVLILVLSLFSSKVSANEGDSIGNEILNLQSFLSLMNLNNQERDTQLRNVAPPFSLDSMTVSGKVIDGVDYAEFVSEVRLRETAFRNMFTEGTQATEEASFLARLPMCSEWDQELMPGLCANPTTLTPNDLFASSLLDTSSYGANGGNAATQSAAAMSYIQNVTNFKPIPLLPEAQRLQPDGALTEEGMRNLLAIYRQQLMISAAQRSLLSMYADRSPFRMEGEENNLPPDLVGKSLLAAMDHEVTRRYGNAEWYQQLNIAPEASLLRELNNQMALSNFIALRTYLRLENIEALQAVQLASIVNMLGGAQEEAAQQADY